jgi:hypothetical protein
MTSVVQEISTRSLKTLDSDHTKWTDKEDVSTRS